jgi:hypothetical protein
MRTRTQGAKSPFKRPLKFCCVFATRPHLPLCLLIYMLSDVSLRTLRLKPLHERLNHLRKPVHVQKVQYRVASQIGKHEPHRQAHSARTILIVRSRTWNISVGKYRIVFPNLREPWCMQGGPHIRVDADRLVVPPYNSTAKEGCEEGDTIVQLHARAGHVELVEKPVDIQERGGNLVKYEVQAIIVCEWTLYHKSANCFHTSRKIEFL